MADDDAKLFATVRRFHANWIRRHDGGDTQGMLTALIRTERRRAVRITQAVLADFGDRRIDDELAAVLTKRLTDDAKR